jgi:hypothetical protein
MKSPQGKIDTKRAGNDISWLIRLLDPNGGTCEEAFSSNFAATIRIGSVYNRGWS